MNVSKPWLYVAMGCLIVLCLTGISGCSTPASGDTGDAGAKPYASNVLSEGDIIQVSFPGATNLNRVIKVPVDGTITLDFAGAFKAAGRTPTQVQQNILEVYGPQLQLKEVTVTLVNSAASVYVSGAVLRPGKVALDRPLTAMEAIMECGGFDNVRARPGKVKIIRQEEGRQHTLQIDLKKALNGTDSTPFYLQPSDVVHVPFKTLNL